MNTLRIIIWTLVVVIPKSAFPACAKPLRRRQAKSESEKKGGEGFTNYQLTIFNVIRLFTVHGPRLTNYAGRREKNDNI